MKAALHAALIMSMLAGICPGQNWFDDVAPNEPYYGTVDLMFERHVTTGCNWQPALFCDETPISRGQMAIFVIRSIYSALSGNAEGFTYPGAPGMSGMAYFSDVPPGHAAFPYVQRMAELGITSGCEAWSGSQPYLQSQGRFCVDESITNWQIAIFAVRARQIREQGGSGQVQQPTGYPSNQLFQDVPALIWNNQTGQYDSNWIYPYIQKARQLTGASITQTPFCAAGPGFFCPYDPMRRGQMSFYLVYAIMGQRGLAPQNASDGGDGGVALPPVVHYAVSCTVQHHSTWQAFAETGMGTRFTGIIQAWTTGVGAANYTNRVSKVRLKENDTEVYRPGVLTNTVGTEVARVPWPIGERVYVPGTAYDLSYQIDFLSSACGPYSAGWLFNWNPIPALHGVTLAQGGGLVAGTSSSFVATGKFLAPGVSRVPSEVLTMNSAPLLNFVAEPSQDQFGNASVNGLLSADWAAPRGTFTVSFNVPLGVQVGTITQAALNQPEIKWPAGWDPMGRLTQARSVTVGDPTPALTSISPSRVGEGMTVPFTVIGSNLGSINTLRFLIPNTLSDCGVTASSVITNAQRTQITANLSVPSNQQENCEVVIVSGGLSGTHFPTPAPNATSAQSNRALLRVGKPCQSITIEEETIAPSTYTAFPQGYFDAVTTLRVPPYNPAILRENYESKYLAKTVPADCDVYWTVSGPATITAGSEEALVTLRGLSVGDATLTANSVGGVTRPLSVPVRRERSPIPVRVVILRDTEGQNSAATLAQVQDDIAIANILWSQAGVRFEMNGSPQYVDSSDVLDPDAQQRDFIRNIHIGTNGFEAYYVRKCEDIPMVRGENKRTGIVICTDAGHEPRTLAHELGHAMGLFHDGETHLHLMADLIYLVEADIRLWELVGLVISSHE
ncbi:MAG: S-layer homology domain-containing protein [Bryobacterales bacterium]|nr:S-layer homology domain-containing protein [Bryobacterales bacterium]